MQELRKEANLDYEDIYAYADDILVTTNSINHTETATHKIMELAETFGMRINFAKSAIVIEDRNHCYK